MGRLNTNRLIEKYQKQLFAFVASGIPQEGYLRVQAVPLPIARKAVKNIDHQRFLRKPELGWHYMDIKNSAGILVGECFLVNSFKEKFENKDILYRTPIISKGDKIIIRHHTLTQSKFDPRNVVLQEFYYPETDLTIGCTVVIKGTDYRLLEFPDGGIKCNVTYVPTDKDRPKISMGCYRIFADIIDSNAKYNPETAFIGYLNFFWDNDTFMYSNHKEGGLLSLDQLKTHFNGLKIAREAMLIDKDPESSGYNMYRLNHDGIHMISLNSDETTLTDRIAEHMNARPIKQIQKPVLSPASDNGNYPPIFIVNLTNASDITDKIRKVFPNIGVLQEQENIFKSIQIESNY